MTRQKSEAMLSPYRVLDLSDEKGVLCGVNHLTGWADGCPVGAYGPYTDYFVPHLATAEEVLD